MLQKSVNHDFSSVYAVCQVNVRERPAMFTSLRQYYRVWAPNPQTQLKNPIIQITMTMPNVTHGWIFDKQNFMLDKITQ